MQPVRTNRIVDASDFKALFGVSRETIARLETYERLLKTWQKTINLVAPRTLDEVWHRHFADSAQIIRTAERFAAMPGPADAAAWPRWVDLGSGAGFPGLVVAILLAERRQGWVTLVDSDQRKAAFLREVVRETGLNAVITVDIVTDRIEAPANRSKSDAVDVISARALAPLPKLLSWAEPYFGKRAVGIFLKGREAKTEVEAASVMGGWSFDLQPSLTDIEARIVVVRRS